MNRKKIFWIIGILAVIVLLIVLKKSGTIGTNDKGIEVETDVVKQITLTETVSATGKIQPEIEIKIASEVSGEIIELPVKEGQQVKKGDLLVRINPDLYTSGLNRTVASLSNAKAGLSQAEAQLKEAKANFERSKKLFDKGIISKAEWDKSVSGYEVAQANRQSAYFVVQSSAATVNESKDNLKRTTIYAPADGTISSLSVEVGERVVGAQQMTGTEIMRLANLSNMEVVVDVNENDIVKISLGNEVDIEVDAYLKRKFKGIVTEISNSANANTTSDQVTNFKVKVRILKESYQDLVKGKSANYSPFRPGMTATVDIITQRKANVLAVPISAIVVKDDTTSTKKDILKELEKEQKAKTEGGIKDQKFECVFVKIGNKAKLKVVKTGIQDDTNIEIIYGLSKSETIITGPYTTVAKELNSGDVVKVSTKEEPTKK